MVKKQIVQFKDNYSRISALIFLGRYTVPRSPDENDKGDLLRQAEPIDYIGGRDDDYYSSHSAGGYQSQTKYPRAKTHRASRPPPKDLFDDV